MAIDYKHTIELSGPTDVVDTACSLVTTTGIIVGRITRRSGMAIDGKKISQLTGGGNLFGQDDRKAATFLRVASWSGLVADWLEYVVAEGAVFTSYRRFESGKEIEVLRTGEFYFRTRDVAIDASLALNGDKAALLRLSEALIQAEREQSNPALLAHLLSIISLLRKFNYRAEPEHAAGWGQVRGFLDELAPEHEGIEWAAKAIQWFKQVARQCEEVL